MVNVGGGERRVGERRTINRGVKLSNTILHSSYFLEP